MDVILVGNSSKMLDGKAGNLIDRFDRVVRFNGGNPDKHTEALGTKTDYWSYSTLLADEFRKWRIPGATPMCLNMRIEYPFMPEDAICNYRPNYVDLIANYGHLRPSTGLITAHFISRMWFAKVSCIGFDFFKSGTWYRGSNEHIPHDGDREREYMKSLGVTVI